MWGDDTVPKPKADDSRTPRTFGRIQAGIKDVRDALQQGQEQEQHQRQQQHRLSRARRWIFDQGLDSSLVGAPSRIAVI